MTYQCDRKRVAETLKRSGVVVVMNKSHVEKPDHMVDTVKAIYEAGYVAEVTFRIDQGVVGEAMTELVKFRETCPVDNPLVLGVGSVINPQELDAAIEMGFEMIVAPANVMGGYGAGCDFVKITQQANVFSAPAVFTPTELNYFLEREDGLEPDGLKIFPARTHGPKGVADLLAPFVRTRHAGKLIMPTGAVDYTTGPEYRKAIAGCGFTPILGMSAPLALVAERKQPGNMAVVKESLVEFAAKFS